MHFAIQVGGGQVRREQTGIEAIIDEAVLAEQLGFDVAFVPDHYVFESLGAVQRDIAAYELNFVLATLAQRTKKLRIGSHVACMLFRHPAMQARLFAQIDEASGGRLIAGVGAGWTRSEFEMMGIEFPPVGQRLKIMDEAVAIMRGLWRDEALTFSGRYFTLKDAVCLPKPAQKPGPAIMLGGSGRGILRRAGEWADIIHMVPALGAAGTTTLEAVREFDDDAIATKLAQVREAEHTAGRAAGSVAFATTIFNYAMTSSTKETMELAGNLAGLFGLSPEQLLRHPVALVGTPDEIESELRRREQEHGLSLLAINFTSVGEVERFGEEVLSRFR